VFFYRFEITRTAKPFAQRTKKRRIELGILCGKEW